MIPFGRNILRLTGLLLFALPLFGQGTHLWVLRASGEMVEYDPANFSASRQ